MRKQILISTFVALFYAVIPASAQLVSFGVKGGIGLTEPTYNSNDATSRAFVGPSIEVRLPGHFAVEFSALYSRSNASVAYTSTAIFAGSSTVGQQSVAYTTHGNNWQFPVIGKYYLGSEQKAWRPYFGTGFAIGTGWFHQAGSATILSGTNLVPIGSSTTTVINADYRGASQVSVPVVAGVRYKVGRFAVLPELRYSYWGTNSYPSRRNNVGFLLGFQF